MCSEVRFPEADMRLVSLFLLSFVMMGISSAQDTNFPVGPQYLMTLDNPLFARPIATPSLSLDGAQPAITSLTETEPLVGNEPTIGHAEATRDPDLMPIYYGYPMPSVVELSNTETPVELPEGMVNTGVVATVDAQSLRDRGYGVPLGDIAAFCRAHKTRATHVYTNADLERLHGG
jgi:hypothetical protein